MPGVAPLLLLLAAVALLLLALVAYLMLRRNKLDEEARIQSIVARGVREPAASAQQQRAAAFRPTERYDVRRVLLGVSGFNPDVQGVGGPSPTIVILLGIAGGVGVFIIMTSQVGAAVALILGVMIGLLVTNALFRAQRRKWQRMLFEQIPDTMGMITRAIRTGLPLRDALESVARDMPEPTRSEFSRLMGDVAIGRGVDQALLQLRERSDLPEYGFLAVTLNLQSRTGGSLAETLDNLGDLVRKRVTLQGKVKALTAEARLGSWVMICLPLVGIAMVSALRPGYADFFIRDPMGVTLAIVGAVMATLGAISIRVLISKTLED